ncbi:MAG: hypothetical protein ACI8TL_000023 [Natronomonas sp.]|jgi:hypothetical protein
MSAALTAVSTVESAASITTQLLGIAAMAALPAAVAAFVYRSVAEEQIPGWLAVAVGVSVAALYLGTAPALEVLLDETDPAPLAAALFDIGGLVGAVGGAALGRAVGDRFGTEVLVWSPTHETDEAVSQLARTVGRVTTVSLPVTIEDAPGYDPVARRTKENLAGAQFVFPRGLTVDELEKRIAEQLRSDYGIGVADMRFDRDGTLASLAVGTRAAGIGATLPPATNAVAVRADPGFSASTGDIVQVWEPDSMQRVCTGELRGVADDVVTIAIDAADTPKVDPSRRYRLVTLPVNDRPDREFASLLRAAEETFSTATVEAGSPLHGLPVGALDLTVTAIRPDDGDPVPFPDRTYRLAPGDLLFVIATPGDLRRLEDGVTALDPSVASTQRLSVDETPPAEGIQTGEPTATAREEPTGEDGLPAGSGPAETPAPSTESEGDDGEAISGKAGSDSFKEIKANFEESDPSTESSEPADDTAEAGATETTDTASFDELKSEFESGEADWDETEPGRESARDADQSADQQPSGEASEAAHSDDELPESDDIEIAFADEEDRADEADSDDELVSLDEADISFDDETDDAGDGELGGIDIDDDLQGDADDAVSDDIGDLDFEDDEDEDVSELDLAEEDGLFSDVDDGDAVEDDEESGGDDTADQAADDGDDDDSEGGGTSFSELKEEFESGDADWEDDVSDSPGGDMRLDE